MTTVALIGPDGSGKSSVARRLVAELPMPAVVLYMGVSLDSSDSMLPTSRLLRRLKRALGAAPDTAGPRDSRLEDPRPPGGWRRALRELRSLAGLVNRLAEEWYRQLLAWGHQLRGRVVIFDRHYLPDYYAFDIAPAGQRRRLSRRIHGWMLAHLYPRPGLLVFLDAPAELLHARKGEGTPELLEHRRQEYLKLGDVFPDFVRVDATQPEAEVAAEVARLVCQRHRGHRGER